MDSVYSLVSISIIAPQPDRGIGEKMNAPATLTHTLPSDTYH
jgi:hypothetical protein